MWLEWDDTQQVIAMYSVLRESCSNPTASHFMIANLLCSSLSPEYVQEYASRSNDCCKFCVFQYLLMSSQFIYS